MFSCFYFTSAIIILVMSSVPGRSLDFGRRPELELLHHASNSYIAEGLNVTKMAALLFPKCNARLPNPVLQLINIDTGLVAASARTQYITWDTNRLPIIKSSYAGHYRCRNANKLAGSFRLFVVGTPNITCPTTITYSNGSNGQITVRLLSHGTIPSQVTVNTSLGKLQSSTRIIGGVYMTSSTWTSNSQDIVLANSTHVKFTIAYNNYKCASLSAYPEVVQACLAVDTSATCSIRLLEKELPTTLPPLATARTMAQTRNRPTQSQPALSLPPQPPTSVNTGSEKSLIMGIGLEWFLVVVLTGSAAAIMAVVATATYLAGRIRKRKKDAKPNCDKELCMQVSASYRDLYQDVLVSSVLYPDMAMTSSAHYVHPSYELTCQIPAMISSDMFFEVPTATSDLSLATSAMPSHANLTSMPTAASDLFFESPTVSTVASHTQLTSVPMLTYDIFDSSAISAVPSHTQLTSVHSSEMLLESPHYSTMYTAPPQGNSAA